MLCNQNEWINWWGEFNGISIRLELFHAKELGNAFIYVHIYIFYIAVS